MHDDDALRDLAGTRPGMCTYPTHDDHRLTAAGRIHPGGVVPGPVTIPAELLRAPEPNPLDVIHAQLRAGLADHLATGGPLPADEPVLLGQTSTKPPWGLLPKPRPITPTELTDLEIRFRDALRLPAATVTAPKVSPCCDDCAYWQLTPAQRARYHTRLAKYRDQLFQMFGARADDAATKARRARHVAAIAAVVAVIALLSALID